MSFTEKRRSGLAGSLVTNTKTLPRRPQNVQLPPPPPSSTRHAPSLSPTPFMTSSSNPPVIPLRRSHSSLNSKFSNKSIRTNPGTTSPTPLANSSSSSNSTSHICLAPQRYLDVPDASPMLTTQSRTPSSASLLFGTMSSTPGPIVSSNYRRLAGNIPGTATNVLRLKSGPSLPPPHPPPRRLGEGLLRASASDHRFLTTPQSTRKEESTGSHSVDSNQRVNFRLQQSTDDEDTALNSCNILSPNPNPDLRIYFFFYTCIITLF